MTSNPRWQAADSIENAISSLADALAELDRIPAHDTAAVGFVAQAVNNYLSVSEATLGLLGYALRDHPDPEVARWLEGLRHLGNLLHHAVGRLPSVSAPAEFPLKPDYLDLTQLMGRACDYYRPAAERKQLAIACRVIGHVPAVWADCVAVAVVADNLLSSALASSAAGGEVLVQILPGPGGVVCGVRNHGPGLTRLEQARLFQRPADNEPPDYALPMAKEFVDRMGGKMWVESEPGIGTCMFFRLPYHADRLPSPE